MGANRVVDRQGEKALRFWCRWRRVRPRGRTACRRRRRAGGAAGCRDRQRCSATQASERPPPCTLRRHSPPQRSGTPRRSKRSVLNPQGRSRGNIPAWGARDESPSAATGWAQHNGRTALRAARCRVGLLAVNPSQLFQPHRGVPDAAAGNWFFRPQCRQVVICAVTGRPASVPVWSCPCRLASSALSLWAGHPGGNGGLGEQQGKSRALGNGAAGVPDQVGRNRLAGRDGVAPFVHGD